MATISIGARSSNSLAYDSHSSYPHRDLVDAPHLIFRVPEPSCARWLTVCHGEASLNYGLAIEPEDEPAGSSLTGCT